MMAIWFLPLLAFFTSLKATLAAPTIALPINAQVPPVAQPGSVFEFTFSPSTFSSQYTISYSLTDAPSWLEIDSAARKLSGQPGTEDMGSVQLGLVATDRLGSTTMSVTLVVSDTQGPSLSNTFGEQLAELGTFQSPQALLFYPESPLNLQFFADAFQETDASTRFFAVGADNTPLPSWLQFDASTLTFRGTTPTFTSATELPQDFEVTLGASDVPGFSQARATFTITVESHELLFASSNYTMQAMPGEDLQYSDLANGLTIDGQAMPLSNITSVSTDQPSWLHLNISSLTFSGIAPSNLESSKFTITVADSIGDTATTTIEILAPRSSNTSNLILGQIGPVNVTIGTFFNYTLDRSDFAQGNISLTLDSGNASSWLQFNASSLMLSGNVPSDSRSQTDVINLMVSEDGRSQSQAITLNLVSRDQRQAPTSTISFSPTSTATTSTTAAATSISAATAGSSHPHLRVILPAVLVPILGLLLLALIFCCLKRRKDQRREKLLRSEIEQQPYTHISRPMLSRASAVFRTRNGFYRPTDEALLPPPVPGIARSRPASRRREQEPVSNMVESRQIPSRPQRPPSEAPQITRMILERDPDPLADFKEAHRLVDDVPRPDSVVLPESPAKALARNRSQSEPQRQSRASMSSLLSRATSHRISAMLQAMRDHNGQPLSETETVDSSTVARPVSEPQPRYTISAIPIEGTSRFDFQIVSHDEDQSAGDVRNDGLNSSGDWTTTTGSVLDPSSSSSGNANRNTSSTINAYFTQNTPERKGVARRTNSRFANTTIRGVTPSMSSFSASNPNSPSKRNSKGSSLLGAKRDSQISIEGKRQSGTIIRRRPVGSSPRKSRPRGSWSSANQYGDFLKARRQGPATIRFSSSGLHRQTSSNYLRSPSMSLLEASSGTMSSGHANMDHLRSSFEDVDKENIGPASPLGLTLASELNASPSSTLLGRERKRSRGSIQRLGRQMQSHHLSPLHTQGRNLPFSRNNRTASTRSVQSASTSTSDISFRAIEEELAEVEEHARYWKSTRQASQRRNSWHRLSALPESQGQRTSSGDGFKFFEGRAAPVQTTPLEEVPTSRSFKAEVGEWRGTDDEGSMNTKRTPPDTNDFFPPAEGGADSYNSTSKVFI